MKAIAIILAAGASRRMGSPKALLEAASGHTFLSLLAQTFARAHLAPLVVLGADAAVIQRAHPNLACVVNPNWPAGQLSSVRVGLRAALAQGAGRLLVHPVDAPLVSAQTAARVLAALDTWALVVPAFEDRPGHPLGLRAAAAKRLLDLSAQTLEEAAAVLGPRRLPVDDPAVLHNVNTPEAWARYVGGGGGGAGSSFFPPNS